jgi:hypothetical protein
MHLLATEFLPIDLTALIASTLGMMVVIIPVLGLTIRFAAKPLVEALRSVGVLGGPVGSGIPARDFELLSRKVLELEQEVSRLKGLPARGQSSVDPLAGGMASPVEAQRQR